jgi:DNA modification methylase
MRNILPDNSPEPDSPINIWLVGQETPSVQRGSRYSRESVKGHPSKMLPGVVRRIINAYTKPGDLILDPMSGIGTTGVEALHLARDYVGMEIEPHFISWQVENLHRARQQGACGEFAVLQSDARLLDPTFSENEEEILRDFPAFDAVIFSPPYGGRLEYPRNHPLKSLAKLVEMGKLSPTAVPNCYGLLKENLGNLKKDSTYFEGMRHVYVGCYKRLKPGGLLILTVRYARKRDQLRPLHHLTARLLTELGFTFLDEIVAVLARITSDDLPAPILKDHSTFAHRRAIKHLRALGLPVTLNQVEYVLVFQKPLSKTSPTTKAAVKPLRSAQPVG